MNQMRDKRRLFRFSLGLLAVMSSTALGSSEWVPLGSGTNEVVRAMTTYQELLIVGGTFTEASGVPASRIAAWDGSSWNPLGQGLNDAVEDLVPFDGSLIVAGRFTQAGGSGANHIARWDGNSWSPLGSGTDDWVRALVVYDGALIAGGRFNSAGGITANSVARWTGNLWEELGLGMNGTVYALAVFQGDLYAGGWFTRADGNPAARIAQWNGKSWTSVGSGTNDWVYSLSVFGDSLVAAGRFTEAGGQAVNYIATWDGNSWSSLGSGTNDWVRTTLPEAGVVAGGFFTQAGSRSANWIALWEDGEWHPLGDGMDAEVRILTIHEGKLFAGGWFLQADGKTVNYIASWDGPLTATQRLYFAQFGDGAQGESNVFSKMTVVNLNSDQAGTITAEFRDGQGELMEVDLNGEAVSGQTVFPIPPGGVRSFRTDGAGKLLAGSVRVSSDVQASGVVLFGGSVGLAGVGASEPVTAFVAPMEISPGLNTGIAMMGLGQDQVVRLELRDEEGRLVATASLELGARGHLALFVNQIEWDEEPDFSDFVGSLKAFGESSFAATVILATGDQLATQPVAAIN